MDGYSSSRREAQCHERHRSRFERTDGPTRDLAISVVSDDVPTLSAHAARSVKATSARARVRLLELDHRLEQANAPARRASSPALPSTATGSGTDAPWVVRTVAATASPSNSGRADPG